MPIPFAYDHLDCLLHAKLSLLSVSCFKFFPLYMPACFMLACPCTLRLLPALRRMCISYAYLPYLCVWCPFWLKGPKWEEKLVFLVSFLTSTVTWADGEVGS